MDVPFTPLDLAALGGFLVCWIGFTMIVNYRLLKRTSINHAMLVHRQEWMLHMIGRDNRISDAALLGSIMGSASFLASTTLVVLAALLGMLGAVDRVYPLLSDLPFAAVAPRQAWEAKVMMLVIMFVYAFFKFTWSIRMWNYCCVLIGAVPAAPVPEPTKSEIARRIAFVAHQATGSFNGGLRAYYFGMAALAWFVHPVAFAVATVWVTAVLYWRQFHSPTAQSLRVTWADYETARGGSAPPREEEGG